MRPFVLLLVWSSLLWGQLEFPQSINRRVNDFGHLMSRDEVAALESKATRWEGETSNQLVIATFESLNGDELSDASIRMAEAWKIGQEGRDNGVLITVFYLDRQARIEVGYGLEGTLTDAITSDIRRNLMNPLFRQGRFYEGLNLTADAIIAAVGGEYEAIAKARPKAVRRRGGGVPLMFIMIVLFLILSRGGRGGGLLPALFWFSLGSGLGSHRGYHGGGLRGFGGGGLGGFGGGGGGFGGGGSGGGW